MRSETRRGRHWRRVWIGVAGVVGVVCLAVGGYALGRYVFLSDIPTSFTATVTTAELRFTSAGTPVDPEENDAGFLAPTGPLEMEILGCSRLESQEVEGPGGAASVECAGRRLRLSAVRLSSLVLAPRSQVTMSVKGERLHVMLPASAVAVIEGEDRSRMVGLAGSRLLGAGEWRVQVANVGLELIFSQGTGPADGRAAGAKGAGAGKREAAGEAVSALPAESDVVVADGSQMLFEARGRSALLDDPADGAEKSETAGKGEAGRKNVLYIARVKDEIPLRDSRLELNDLRSTTIRHLTVEWSEAKGFSALHAVVSGRSDQLLIYGMYNETGSGERDQPANEALSRFDQFAAGRSTRSLVAGATALVSIPALLTAMLSLMNGSWELVQKTRGAGRTKGEGH